MILRRIEGSRFSRVEQGWPGRTVVLLGSGPSLTLDQVAHAHAAHEDGQAKCIAVNDTYLVAPWADVQYSADSHWHVWHCAGIAKPVLGMSAAQVREAWAGFAGQKCSIRSSGGNILDDRVHMLRNRDFPKHGFGLSLDPEILVTGRNSGFQALNLAVLAGAARIILLGFDGQRSAAGVDHFHGGHPRPTPEAAYPLYRGAMIAACKGLAEVGVEVLNCSPGSAIDCFPRAAVEDVFEA